MGIVGRTWNHLGYGRLKLIHELQLLTVVVYCPSILPGQELSLMDVFKRHGPIAEVNAMVGKATITFDRKESVVSAIAAENDVLLNGMKKTVEIFTDAISANAAMVKISTLALIHNITEVCLKYRGKLEEDKIRSVFSKFGDIAEIDTLSENIRVKFCSASSVCSALSSANLRNTEFEPFILPGRLQQTLSVIQPLLDLPENQMIDPPNFQSQYPENLGPLTNPTSSGEGISLPPVVPNVPPLLTPMIDVKPAMTVPPPGFGPQVPAKLTNHIEIVCTMPECIEYSKQVCSTLRCLELRVGVLRPPPGAKIEDIVESIKASGVVAAVFLDKCNQEQTTLSVKFFDHRNIKLKDVPLHLAVGELNRAFMENRNDDITRAKIHQHAQEVHDQTPPNISKPPPFQAPLNKPPPLIQPPPFALPPTQFTIPPPALGPTRIAPNRDPERSAMKRLVERLFNEKSILLKDIDDMMKYFLDKREHQLAIEYDHYIPHRIRQPPIGPFGDMEKKIAKENIEDVIDDILKRNLAEDLEHIAVENMEKQKLSSAPNSLLALGTEELKNLTDVNSKQSFGS